MRKVVEGILENFKRPNIVIRLIILFISVIVMGFSIGALKLVGWGTDPLSTLSFGLSTHLPIVMGTIQLIINILMFIPEILFKPACIGIGTLANMVLVGYATNGAIYFASNVLNITTLEGINKIIVFIIAIIVLIFSVGIYSACNMGLAPYDAIPQILFDKLKKYPFWLVRALWDIVFTFCGFLLGGQIGLTTLFLCFGLGPIISIVSKWLSPILDKK